MKTIRPCFALAALLCRRLFLVAIVAISGTISVRAEESAQSTVQEPSVPNLPKWTLIARTGKSVPLGTVVLGDAPSLRRAPTENAVRLDEYGYAEDEYFISGTSNPNAAGDRPNVGATRPNTAYTTRIVVRRPVDPSRFSGTVQLEPVGDRTEAVTSWTWAWPYFVSNHDIWVGITVSKDSVETLRSKFDPTRYAPLEISDEGLSWDILSQVAWLVRSPDGPLGKEGYLDQAAVVPGLLRVYASGWSSAGCMLAEFLDKGRDQQARRPDGRPLIDGYIVGTCPVSGPVAIPHDAAVIQVMSESEYSGAPVSRDAVIAARRPDGNKAGEHRYRWYDVAGVADAGYLDQPALSLAAYQIGWSQGPGADCAKPIGRVSTMNDTARALFRNLDEWVRIGRYPPHGAVFQLDEDHTVKRDQYGNVLGGLRPYWVDVPSFRFVLAAVDTARQDKWPEASAFCAHIGYEEAFSGDQFSKLYKNHDDYVEKVTDAVILLVNGRYMLAADADALLAALRGNKGRQAVLTGGG